MAIRNIKFTFPDGTVLQARYASRAAARIEALGGVPVTRARKQPQPEPEPVVETEPAVEPEASDE